MTVRYQDPAVIEKTLRGARTVAIVGLSKDPLRPSNFIGFYLQRHGYRIVPVNPREPEILGETSYPSLTDIPFPVDIVDVFRRPDAVPDIAREAVAIGAKALWLQFGVISPEGARIALHEQCPPSSIAAKIPRNSVGHRSKTDPLEAE